MTDLDLDSLEDELKDFAEPDKKGGRSPREERVIAGFEEIQKFVNEYGRQPLHGEGRDIFEPSTQRRVSSRCIEDAVSRHRCRGRNVGLRLELKTTKPAAIHLTAGFSTHGDAPSRINLNGMCHLTIVRMVICEPEALDDPRPTR